MEYSKLEYYVSQARLSRFLRACGGSKNKAQKLYKINLRVAQAFYPLLNLFEIFLRNALNNHIASYYGDADWLQTQTVGFMNHGSLMGSRFYLKNCVIMAQNKLLQRRLTITSGRIVSEQTFGFWSALFDNHNYRLMAGAPIQAFPHKPSYINRSQISDTLKRIREFRNRIYHNEPICFNGTTIDFSPATQAMNNIHDMISWIDPALLHYTAYFNNINKKIAMANTL